MLLRNVRYACLQMRKAPAFTLTVVLMLALGIGANTAVFSVVDAVMLRPLPYADPQQLVQVDSYDEAEGTASNVSYPDFFDWRARSHSFSHLVSFDDKSYTLTGAEHAVHLDGEVVSWDLLPMLGVRSELGRGFVADEEKKGTRVVLISHALWQSQFNGDQSIVGRSIQLSGSQFTVIGVMPASFRFPITEPNNAFWTTLSVDDENWANRGMHFFSVMGRLKPGVTIEQANQEMKSITAQLAKAYPDTNTRHGSALVQSELRALLVVLGGVALAGMLAAYIPAARAASIEPMQALREE